MLFLSKKKLNLFTLILVQILANFTVLYSLEKKTYSFPIEQKNDNREIRNKQSSKIGQFKLIYESQTQHKNLEQKFKESGLFDKVVRNLNNQKLNLPVDIPIYFGDCGISSAFYVPSKQLIGMCYELYDDIANSLASTSSSQEELQLNSMLVLVFVLYHEAGHALTDVLNLAVTGKEEDAVDDFASILLLKEDNPLADRIVLNTSVYFSTHEDSPYWDEHSFGRQRFYNIVCLLYGKNPQQYANIPKAIDLGKRKDRCSDEYQQKLSSWERLLAPHSIYDSPNQSPNSSDETIITW